MRTIPEAGCNRVRRRKTPRVILNYSPGGATHARVYIRVQAYTCIMTSVRSRYDDRSWGKVAPSNKGQMDLSVLVHCGGSIDQNLYQANSMKMIDHAVRRIERHLFADETAWTTGSFMIVKTVTRMSLL